MTPGARVAAAIEILDDIQGGQAAEQALTRWARRSRFAGSKDRAAIRDHVFDVLRCRSLAAHFGRGEAGRQLMLGLLHLQEADIAAFVTGDGHAPEPATAAELDFPAPPGDRPTLWCLPEWLVTPFETSLGEDAARTAGALQARAPIVLRVNLARIQRQAAADMLREQGVETTVNPLAEAALTVTEGQRRIRNSSAFAEGLIELQDAASQAVVAALPPGGRVLDYCAGGGARRWPWRWTRRGRSPPMTSRPPAWPICPPARHGRVSPWHLPKPRRWQMPPPSMWCFAMRPVPARVPGGAPPRGNGP
jgi:tRNA and rRNA cytosine-C5-methylases